MHLRYIKKVKGEVSLHDPIGVDKEGNEVNLADVLGTHPEIVPDAVEKKLENKRLLDEVKKLTNREKTVLGLRYGLANSPRLTQREIAKTLGISRSYVSRIEKKALSHLTKEYTVESK
jgi:RNA polymerase sporulation-specific sigma factor